MEVAAELSVVPYGASGESQPSLVPFQVAQESENNQHIHLLAPNTFRISLNLVSWSGLIDNLGAEAMMMEALDKVKKEINKPLLRSNKKNMALLHAKFDKINKKIDEDEYGDDEEWMENAVPKRPMRPIEIFHKIHYNDTNDLYNETNGWTSKLAEARYNEMIALQKWQEDLDEAKHLSEKEICAKVLGKRSACAFSFKPTTCEEEFEAENEQFKSEL